MKTIQQKKIQSRRRLLGDFRLMFGKYAGKPIRAVPDSYLRWAVAADGEIPAPDRWAIGQYLNERGGDRRKKRRGRSKQTGSAAKHRPPRAIRPEEQSDNAADTGTGAGAHWGGGQPA
jgi:uncharacterized protein (DUF3820 family)